MTAGALVPIGSDRAIGRMAQPCVAIDLPGYQVRCHFKRSLSGCLAGTNEIPSQG